MIVKTPLGWRKVKIAMVKLNLAAWVTEQASCYLRKDLETMQANGEEVFIYIVGGTDFNWHLNQSSDWF